MGIIRNPNDIVDTYVTDYKNAFGDNLSSVIMYGSAVSHEYKPGISDINTIIVLQKDQIAELSKGLSIAAYWAKKNVVTPFFMTREYINSSLDTYPIEFIDMRSNYKVLFGDDVFSRLDIQKEHVRLQCERELKGIALHFRREYIRTNDNKKILGNLLVSSLKTLLPVFKALLVLNDRAIPKLKCDIIIAVEELYNLGISVFTELCVPHTKIGTKRSLNEIIGQFALTIDALIKTVDSETNKKEA